MEQRLLEEKTNLAHLQERLQHAEQKLDSEREELIAQVVEVHQAEADRREYEIRRMS